MKNFLVMVFGLVAVSSAHAMEVNDALNAFQKVLQVPTFSIKVPTVVEVPFSEVFVNRFNFAVVDDATKSFEPYLLKETLRSARNAVSASSDSGAGTISRVVDGDTDTYTEFPLATSGQKSSIIIRLKGEKPMTLSALGLVLDSHVALPTSIEVRALVNGAEKIVLAQSVPQQTTILFPKTTAQEWILALTYAQPLRINEILLRDETAGVENFQAIRFLAQPGHTYHIYADADRHVSIPVGESGNLVLDKGVLTLPHTQATANPLYVLADIDGDTIPDIKDNCVTTANTDQMDVDQNGRGDVCDDFDRDGVSNSTDNCSDAPNRNQMDTDADGKGDVCDGEESRVTEKYPWLPWAGMGFAGLLLVVLFTITARSMMLKK